MNAPLFHIHCPTCEARLAVRNRELIGQILACPKCESMVQVNPPPNWEDREAPPSEADAGEPVSESSSREPADPPPSTAPPSAVPDEATPSEKQETESDSSELEFAPRTKPLSPTEQKTRNIMMIASGILAVFLLLLAVILLWPDPRPQESAGKGAGKPPMEKEDDSEPSSQPLPGEAEEKQDDGSSQDKSTEVTAGQEDTLPETPSDESETHQKDAPTEDKPSAAEENDETSDEEEKKDTTSSDEDNEPTTDDASDRPETDKSPSNSQESVLPQLDAEQEVKKIDIGARLQNPIEEIRFSDIAFVDAVAVLRSLVGVPIQVDLDTLHWRGKSLTDPVRLTLQATTARTALEKVSETLGLVPEIREQHILLTLPEGKIDKPETDRYPVEDLLEAIEALDSAELIALIEEMIATKSWQSANGPGEIRIEGGELVILQTSRNQYRITQLLDKLRLIHHLDPKSSLDPEVLAPEAFGWDHLQQRITLNYLKPVPLREILNMIAEQGNLHILIDRPALASVGLSPRNRAMLRIEQGTIADALSQLLSPLGLTYRILEHDVIEVTSSEEAESRKTVEIHRYPPPEADESIDDLVATLKAMAPDSLETEGSDTAFWVDEEADCLVLRESQPFQRMVRKWLQEERHRRTESPESGSP